MLPAKVDLPRHVDVTLAAFTPLAGCNGIKGRKQHKTTGMVHAF